MAKVVKDTRKTIDVDSELTKIKGNKKDTKKTAKKEDEKKKTTKSSKTNKKTKKGLGIVTFFKEVKNEVSKVKWPTKKDMFKYSLATIIFVIFFALFFYLIDLIIALLKAGV